MAFYKCGGGLPTQTKSVTAGTSNKTVTPDSGYSLSQVTVSPTPSQQKTYRATTSQYTVTPDSGKYLSSVVVQPQNHSGSATPTSRTSQYDLGQNHNVRYVDTTSVPTFSESVLLSQMLIPAGDDFPSQTVELNQSMMNYKYIKILYVYYMFEDGGEELANFSSFLIETTNFHHFTENDDPVGGFALVAQDGANLSEKYVRFAYYVSDTKIKFSNVYQIGSSTIKNRYLIPHAIYGYR